MDGFEGVSGVQSFWPGWSRPEVLEETLAGRKELVDRLEELAIDGAGGPNKHQRLIVGVRGSGKTHVLRVLHNRLWANEELKERLLIVYLLEDELGVASFLDFVVRMLRAIVRGYPERKELAENLEAIYDLPAASQEGRAVELLLDAARSKDVLIVMENLGVTFDDVKGFGREGQEKLRDLVQQHPRFMIFASSQALVEGTRNPDRPFYEFFKVIHLRRLTLVEAMTFLVAIASALDKKELVRFLKRAKGRARMQAIYEFTCGNHRLLVTFYQLLTTESVVKLSELFMEALGPLKPYYQEQMRSLSAQQQKIVQYLSLKRTPCAVKDIARGCLAAPNTISSQLRGLLTRHFVNKIEEGRESHYEVTEALFRICYEADLEQEGAPVRLFMDFLVNYYTGQELLIRHRGFDLLARKLGNAGSVPFADEAELYRKASLCHPDVAGRISQEGPIEYEGPGDIRTFFAEMEKSEAYREIVEFSRHLGKEKDAFVLHVEAGAYAHLGEGEKAKAAALEALEKDPDDVEAHLVLADVLSREPEGTDESLKHAHRARELAPKDRRALACIGLAYGIAGDHTEALRNFELLNREHPGYSRGRRLTGQALHNLKRTEEAESAYGKALECNPENATALNLLGNLVGNAGRHEEALGLFHRLNEVEPDSTEGLVLTGRALQNLKRTEEAEGSFRRALELDPRNGEALNWLGTLCNNGGRYEEALGLFRQLNEVAPEYAEGWTLTGRALENLKGTEEAESAYRKALETDLQNATALNLLGRLVGNSGRYEEALGLFRQLNEVAPEYAEGWVLTGQALQNLKRTEEAESAYRKALELDPRNEWALNWLGTLCNNGGRYEEALGLFRQLNEVAPEYAEGWALTGRVLDNLKQTKEAESAFRKALELDPRNALALNWLGTLCRNAGRYEESLGLFRRLNEVSPEYAKGWALTGVALHSLKRTEEAEAAYCKALELDSTFTGAVGGLGILCHSAGRYEEALGLFRRLNEVIPQYAEGWALTGAALGNLRRTREAEGAYGKALELDGENTTALFGLGMLSRDSGRHEEGLELFQRLNKVAPKDGNGWAGTAAELEYLGRDGEALEAFEEAIRLGANRADLLNRRGEARRELGKYEAAIADYEEALGCDAQAVWPQFNIVSSQLGLGNIEAALERLAKALGADKASEEPGSATLVQSLQENCEALFEHGPIRRFEEYLGGALEIIEEAGYLEQMEQSIALTVFGLLKGHEGIEEKRFGEVVRAFEEVLGRRIDVRMAVHFLQVGIDYFKKGDRRALLRLTREERETFCKEVGIKDPGGER